MSQPTERFLHGLHFPQYSTGHFQKRTRNDFMLPIGAVSNSHSTNQQLCTEHLYNVLLIWTVDGNVEVNAVISFRGCRRASAFNDYRVTFLQLLKSGGV